MTVWHRILFSLYAAPVAMTAFAVIFALFGVFYLDYPAAVVRVPVLVAVFLAGLCLVECVRLRRARATEEEPPVETGSIGTLAWIAAALPACLVFGFGAGLPLYVFAYLKTHGISWLAALAVGAGVFAVTAGGFATVLGVPLPLWPTWP